LTRETPDPIESESQKRIGSKKKKKQILKKSGTIQLNARDSRTNTIFKSPKVDVKKIRKNTHLRVHETEMDLTCEADMIFIRDFLVPYLSNIFRSLIERTNSEYLPLWKVKEYLSLPGLIG
jgi:hypothetical protein